MLSIVDHFKSTTGVAFFHYHVGNEYVTSFVKLHEGKEKSLEIIFIHTNDLKSLIISC